MVLEEEYSLHDYDRKKCKKMRYVFHKKSEKLTEEDQWYLNRYLGFSQELMVVYDLKETFSRWFRKVKENGLGSILQTNELLNESYQKVEKANIHGFKKAIQTLQKLAGKNIK